MRRPWNGKSQKTCPIKSNQFMLGGKHQFVRMKELYGILSAVWLSVTLPLSAVPAVSAPEQFGLRSQDTLAVARVTAERDASTSRSTPLQRVSQSFIERSGASGIHEIVRTFPGVNIRDYGGIGGLKTVSIRDIGAQHTAVCYDGIVISNAQNAQIDISRFSLGNLSEITVETGGSDDIFRSARLLNAAGILSLSTLNTGDRVSAGLTCASFGTYQPSIYLCKSISNSISASASLDCLTSSGSYPFSYINGDQVTNSYRTGSDVRSLNGEVSAKIKPSTARLLTAKFRYYNSERGLPGQVIYYIQEPTERLWDNELSTSITYRSEASDKWRFFQALNFDISRTRYTDSSAYYSSPKDDRYHQHEYSSSSVAEIYLLRNLRLAAAADILVNTLDATIPECPQPVRFSLVPALSGQWKDEHLTLTGSISGTLIREKLSSRQAPSPISRLSPSISASVKLTDGLRIRASFRDGFRAPTFNELYYTRIGNGALRPEKAEQFNLGLTYILSGNYGKANMPYQFSATLDLYHNRIRDKILAVPTLFIWKMRNLGKVSMTGADIFLNGRMILPGNTSMHLTANCSVRKAIDITDPQSKNYRHQIQYTPIISGNILFDVRTRWADLTYTLNAVGRRYCLPQNIKANEMPAYFDHSISIGKSFTFRAVEIRIAAEAQNLSGENYEVVRFYPMPGRNYRIMIKFTY